MRGEFSEENAKRNVCARLFCSGGSGGGGGVSIGGFGWREMELKKD